MNTFLGPALFWAPRRWPGALVSRPTLLRVPVVPGCVRWFASSREPDGQDVVPHGAAGSSEGRWTQTNNNSVRRCHGNLEEQSRTLCGDDLRASAGRLSTGNQDLGSGPRRTDTSLGRAPTRFRGVASTLW